MEATENTKNKETKKGEEIALLRWKEEIINERRQKDIFFKTHVQSPIPFEYRKQFEKLQYFEVNSEFRFKLKLYEHDDKKIIQIEDTKGVIRQFIRWGEFRFKVENEQCTLQAYKSNPDEERLFIPFRDMTNGKETYGAGRYIDLEPDDRTEDGDWLLDFNTAYNPWCAYSENYACPFVPPENWLKIPIYAGEKNINLKMMERE